MVELSGGLLPLGRKLRQRRLELGLTLKQVAQGAGLSVGFISQIERGIATPSLSSLVSVARVLGSDIGEFLSQPKVEVPITRRNERPKYSIHGNPLSYERLSASFPGTVLRSVIIHEPPGHRSEPISHEGEELFYVLDGAITVEVDGERTVLEAGDSLHFPSTKIHSSWNHSTRPATILWVGTMDVFGDDPGEEQRVESGARHRSDNNMSNG
ncbi:helix-turn-helix domain-containing protein [Oricola thermophila]|uniref:Cupin domain-containing protein n=1 Tax=Oricola thermophila TaxID=2742145 RepID=A0A6N1VGY7_9HYPH|nr:cupin domain-containing protein [Oricola thermophila]QKV18267.1 cupin domain-containing protein [Oricola thermophila]